VARARKDAQAAVADGVAEGHYQLGRLNEELGQVNAAITSYRAAVNAHRKMDAEGSRYRVALARALLKRRSATEPARPRPVPPAERTGKAPAKPGKPRRVTSLELLNLLMAITLQAPDLPVTGKNVREAEKLADEILASKNKLPFDVVAQALAVKGFYTKALETYTAGLRDQGLLAPRYANGMLDLIAGHPRLKQPDSLAVPDPAAGERHYSSGLTFFAARRYADAEKEFLMAVENDNGDARYYYFLGLSRLAQNKRSAYEDFDQAARLERLGRPDRGSVSAALERVQGPMRRTLNQIRNRPVRERAR
jgi:tetratricopeptide (TPR) repeat protein